MSKLANKVALVTGASRGIGRAIAVRLAKEGAHVVINYASREDQAMETVRLIKEAGGADPLVIGFSVSDSDAVKRAIDTIDDKIGGVDILVNNAGVTEDGLLVRTKDESWRRMMGTNLDGAFYCARACARGMIKKRGGRIVQISSVVGEMGNAGQVAYSSAKAGLFGLTKSLARELASRQITVNAIAPGFIETDMTAEPGAWREQLLANIPLGYFGQAEDVASVVCFLASDEARYMTGQIIGLNGGMYM